MLILEKTTGSTELLDPGHGTWSVAVTWAEKVLREQAMPADELRTVLPSEDRALVRRHLDLHLERLDERVASEKRRVELVRLILTDPHRRERR
jgi:hypothetical protein